MNKILMIESSNGQILKVGDKILLYNDIIDEISELTIYFCKLKNTKGLYSQKDISLYIEPKPEFILPERWCVKNTEERIGKWFNQQTNSVNTYTGNNHRNSYLHNFNSLNQFLNNFTVKAFAYYRQRENCIEITLEQFKKYVLKE